METLITIWRPLIEITVLSVLFYYFYSLIEGTRAIQVLRGLILIICVFFAARLLELQSIYWLMTKVFALSVIGFIVLFQPELRRALAQLGGRHFLSLPRLEEQTINEIAKTARILSDRGFGCLIAIEKLTGLRNYIMTGVKLDSLVSSELLTTIFTVNTPLHDGGVIISENRISAGACLFPLSQQVSLSKTLGTRHRAALGLSEESDAVVIVVSEETGTISVAENGELIRDFTEQSLIDFLKRKETISMRDQLKRLDALVHKQKKQTHDAAAVHTT